MLTVQEIIQLKEAGFTADEITKFSNIQETSPAEQPKESVEQPKESVEHSEEPARQPKERDVWEEINQAIYHK